MDVRTPPARPESHFSPFHSMYRPVRITCHAPHPDPAKPATTCSALLGYIPGPIAFAGIVQQAPAEPDGYAYARCQRSSCRAWNRFEIVAPAGAGDDAAMTAAV